MTKPAFVGEFETPVTLRLLGDELIRDVKVEYGYTPRWPYYSVRRRSVVSGEYQFGLSICVLPEAGIDGKRADVLSTAEEQWALSQMLAIGVLKPDLHEQIRSHVDDIAKRQDRENREGAGVSPDTPDVEAI